MMRTKPIGLYVHIPFCLKKCNYCDFSSFSNLEQNQRKEYIDALCNEIKSYKSDNKITVDSIFFGGGTPSLLDEEEFSEIYDSIAETFEISENAEFTMEVNPKTLTSEKLSAYTSMGVNRISIGLQTIHDNEYKILGRIHNFQDFENTFNTVKAGGITNINVDLMYGIPGQTYESFNKTLDTIASFRPTHISAYSLILEEGTKLWKIKDTLAFPTEDTECAMYDLICNKLSELGYCHYEISNYSLAGFESRHNLKYWHCQEYIGVGLSAYSYFSGKRFGNTSNFSEYISQNSTKYAYEEIIDKSKAAYEYVMLALRLKEGFSLSEYEQLFSKSFLSGREDTIAKYVTAEYIQKKGDRLSLTEKGFYISNTILTDLI